MNKCLLLLLCLFGFSCAKQPLYLTQNLPLPAAPVAAPGTLILVQSTDIIASRVAQDQFIRLWKYPALQGYNFLKENYLSHHTLPAWKQKMEQQNLSYLLLIHLTDSVAANPKQLLVDAYLQHFAKRMYDPIYALKSPAARWQISLYQVANEELIWQATTAYIPKEKLAQHFQELVPQIQKAFEKNNYFTIIKSNR
jgi:hypothetical protein